MELDIDTQERLIAALKRNLVCRADDIEHVHTHISHVLLCGAYAYKIKKPVDLGFLNFSTLARRKHFCEEELRLNARLAPATYVDVLPITGPPERPELDGDGEVLDYLVRMRRFSADGLLSRRPLGVGIIDEIAGRVARFHQQAPTAAPDSEFGRLGAVLAPMLHNFSAVRRSGAFRETARLDALEAWTRQACGDLEPLLERRREQGRIRECHGDLHLGNITLEQGEPIIFDGIDFDPGLRWIDVISDSAFLIMDLQHRAEPALASRFLDSYLAHTGDYDALAIVDLYRVYRAMVKVKVESIRLGQADLPTEEHGRLRADVQAYLALAESATRPGKPALIITHGVSGSGKSHAAARLVEELGAVRVRSDVERKRLHGLAADKSSRHIVGGIYTREATLATYQALLKAAGRILRSGRVAVVDAAFLRREQRALFHALAQELNCPFLILCPSAPRELLRHRISLRIDRGNDPSEADHQVLQAQERQLESLRENELDYRLSYAAGEGPPLKRIRDQLKIK